MSVLKIPVTEQDHIQGNDNAVITLVEYGDYECPYCGLAYPIVKRLQQHFGSRLRFVFRNFPLVDAHPYAEIAAITAEFAASHDKFWEMHDLLYENQDSLDMQSLLTDAESLDLSATDLQTAIENVDFLNKIKNDFLGGVKSGVNGTPAFFINGHLHQGSYAYEDLLEALNQAESGK